MRIIKEEMVDGEITITVEMKKEMKKFLRNADSFLRALSSKQAGRKQETERHDIENSRQN